MTETEFRLVIDKVQAYIESLFVGPAIEKLVYHSLAHTKMVVAAAIQIANHYQLNSADFFTVTAAAWFHDIGYLTDAATHEEIGAIMAADFLRKNNVDEPVIANVQQCIIATKMPQNPTGLLQQIVCDADLFRLGTDDFAEGDKLFRKEVELWHNKEISKDDWRKGTIKLFKTHHYHTDYAQLLLNDKKQEYLNKLIQKAEKKEAKEAIETAPLVAITAINTDDGKHTDEKPTVENVTKDKKEKKPKRPEKGIETVFRITSSNNQKLSTQADSKAHIMIQVNSIIISVLFSLLLRKLDEKDSLLVPCFMLVTVNLVTIIFSVLATRPHIPKGTFDLKDLEEKKVNLLFFGNFYRMSLDQYSTGMLAMMDDSVFLYNSLIRDVYFQGVVLGKKYRLLRLSYNVFMFGLIASVIGFILAATVFATHKPV